MSAAPRYIITKSVHRPPSLFRPAPCARPRASPSPKLTAARARRSLDPVFAVSVGLAAALVRVSREEKEKGRSAQETLSALGRRAVIAREEMAGAMGWGG
ncbi:MAG: non-classical export protein 1 [Terriglobus roseus]|nr:non-classical export protein 1 [Terriglobus roseus]